MLKKVDFMWAEEYVLDSISRIKEMVLAAGLCKI